MSARELASGLYVGTVRHRRHRPRVHAFRHRTYHVLVDVDELARLDRDVVGFGWNRPALTSFHDRDHLGPDDLPVRDKLQRRLAAAGVPLPGGPLRVLTNLRVAGHVFNPVSWWFCHRPDGSLAFVVAEVHNTFGGSHRYLLDTLAVDRRGLVHAHVAKELRVSPFLPTTGLRYRFTLVPPDGRVVAHVTVDDGVGTVLDATQVGRRVELTPWSLVRALLRHPVMPLRTLVLIHLHALRLWGKGVPVLRDPIGSQAGRRADDGRTAQGAAPAPRRGHRR